MSASPAPAESASPAVKPAPSKTDVTPGTPSGGSTWKKYLSPILVLLLALAIVITITRNWNAWEGGKVEKVTDDAYVRGDLTPLSTKVAGIVRAVRVEDFQQVHKGDLIVELQDDDYRAQVDQASGAVAAARAAIENNRRQRELQDSRIAKALAGIDQGKAEIATAEAGKKAVEAQLVRASSERKRQEGLYQTHSTTQQALEAAVANGDQLTAQLASRDADLVQAQAMLRSSELGAEAERRSKAVLESQDLQLQADLLAKQAALAAATVNLGYTKIYAPGDGTVGERQVRPGQLGKMPTPTFRFSTKPKPSTRSCRRIGTTNEMGGQLPCLFERIGRGRSAWCRKAELSCALIQKHQGSS